MTFCLKQNFTCIGATYDVYVQWGQMHAYFYKLTQGNSLNLWLYFTNSFTMTLGTPFAHIYLTKFPIHSLYAIKNISRCNIHPLGLIFLQHMVNSSMSTIKTNCQTYWQGCIEIHLIHNIETKWNKKFRWYFKFHYLYPLYKCFHLGCDEEQCHKDRWRQQCVTQKMMTNLLPLLIYEGITQHIYMICHV